MEDSPSTSMVSAAFQRVDVVIHAEKGAERGKKKKEKKRKKNREGKRRWNGERWMDGSPRRNYIVTIYGVLPLLVHSPKYVWPVFGASRYGLKENKKTKSKKAKNKKLKRLCLWAVFARPLMENATNPFFHSNFCITDRLTWLPYN